MKSIFDLMVDEVVSRIGEKGRRNAVYEALVFRQWKNRVKGRDWYDFEWYVRNNVPLDFEHLKIRASEFNGLDLTREEFLNLLRERLASTDINAVKADVEPFVINPRELEIWSNDYFLQLADRVSFQ